MTDTRLKNLLDTAVGQPPQARYDIDAAIRSGARRRTARTVATVVTLTGVVALYATGTMALAGHVLSTAPTVAAASSPSAASTSTAPQATSQAPSRLTLAQLETLAREVASPAHGTVTVASREETPPGQGQLTRTVRLHVTMKGAGTFDVAAILDTNMANSVTTWSQACTNDNGGQSTGRACTPVSESPTQGIWSRSYDAQAGRRSLMLAATLPTGDILTIKIDNYTEQLTDAKSVGPAWSSTGITAETLANAAATVTRSD